MPIYRRLRLSKRSGSVCARPLGQDEKSQAKICWEDDLDTGVELHINAFHSWKTIPQQTHSSPPNWRLSSPALMPPSDCHFRPSLSFSDLRLGTTFAILPVPRHGVFSPPSYYLTLMRGSQRPECRSFENFGRPSSSRCICRLLNERDK